MRNSVSRVIDHMSRKGFNWVHSNNLIYNTCWEDPRLDRQALDLGPTDRVMMITSAGCNVLDYLLDGPQKICAIDVNPHQNALLELKIAGIKGLSFEEFFEIFGKGKSPFFEEIYQELLRPLLSPLSQEIWDQQKKYFSAKGSKGFYYRGTSGAFALAAQKYISLKGVREFIEKMFEAKGPEEQHEVYFKHIRDVFWPKWFNTVLEWDVTLSLLGVPRAQKQQIVKSYEGGVAQFMQDCVESVFTKLPLSDNYFWWLYFNGSYTKDRCPEYLKKENFEKLKGLVDRVEIHTQKIEPFLNSTSETFSRFVLLDHMDWLGNVDLRNEWQALVDSSDKRGTRFLWRSGCLDVDFVDPLIVSAQGEKVAVSDLLTYDQRLAKALHPKDRVHTYGSFYIADLAY